MSSSVRTAVIGYGLAGRVFHCPFISAIPGMVLQTIVQRHGDGAGEAFPSARIVRSPEEAFADPEIDLVVVATPNDTHEALALAALRSGKHVVVDKPMAPTSKEVLSLSEAARSAGKLLIPFHNRRWDGDFLTLQRLVATNRLGRLVKVVSQWDRFRPIPREESWREQAAEGHGILQDLGTHLLDQALALFGLPKEITASVRQERAGSLIEDAFDVVLGYDLPQRDDHPARLSSPIESSGCTLLFHCSGSMIAADAAPRLQAHGTLGSFVKCGLDPQEAHLVANGRHPPQLGSSVPWIEDAESAWGVLTLAPDPRQPATLTRERIPTETGDYRSFYAGVRDAILHNAPPPVSAVDAYRVAQLIELARQSSRERRTLSVH